MAMKYQLTFKLIILFCLLPYCSFIIMGQEITNQFGDIPIKADDRVERGFLLFGSPLSHFVQRPNGFELPKYDTNSERFKSAVYEFQTALRQKKDLKSFTEIEVQHYLAKSYCKLAMSLNEEVGESSINEQYKKVESSLFFNLCFREYDLLLLNKNFSYYPYYSKELIEGIISSGDLDFALAKIADLRKNSNGKNNAYTYLLKLEADIYFLMGKNDEAGKKYQNWLENEREFNTIDEKLLERFRLLEKETGYPKSSSINKVLKH